MLIRWSAFFFCSGLAFAASAPTFPVLTYSTYLRDAFTPTAIATDSSGNIYMAGNAIVDPATAQTTVLVVKLNPQASQYLYVRYLGGSVADYANAIAVDGAGNAYVAGSIASPDFPVTSGGNLGTAPTGPADQRSFVAKLDASGVLVFSDLLGASTNSAAQAVAVNAAGRILVSGNSVTEGFPSTAGAYSIPNTANHPYLLELDPTGTKTVFSATGIGGSAIALDSSGNIYVAGTTYLLDYPTTPGTYQATFPAFLTCYAPCTGSFQGANQYVTKVDPSGSRLIYSTAVSGSGNTINHGLAVDGAGNVYLTGSAGPTYPFTVTVPVQPPTPVFFPVFAGLPFLSKLDPAGQTLLFSIPAGGAGVQVDTNGSVYVGGETGYLGGFLISATIPALANIPNVCLPNLTSEALLSTENVRSAAYVSQVDATSGNVLGTQFIGGSTLTAAAVALSGSTLWIAGATNLPDFPFTPNALTLPDFGPVSLAGTPQILCVASASNLAPAGPAAPNQLLTVFGAGLGPAAGTGAADSSTTRLAGVSVSFGGVAAPLLYVSSTQINFAVPFGADFPAAMQVTVNGVAGPLREVPMTSTNPSLFLNIPQTFPGSGDSPGFVAVALNADGSLNSPANPAQLGAIVSVFVNGLAPTELVNGLAPNPETLNAVAQLYTDNGWTVTNVVQATPFVLQVDLQTPAPPVSLSCFPSPCTAGFTLYNIEPVYQSAGLGTELFTMSGMVYVYVANVP
jgi:uncharacterized protein (TIGR03437 family)